MNSGTVKLCKENKHKHGDQRRRKKKITEIKQGRKTKNQNLNSNKKE